MDTLNAIMILEGEDSATIEQQIDALAFLIKSGVVYSLQGSYGRMARIAIESGYISESGDVLEYPIG